MMMDFNIPLTTRIMAAVFIVGLNFQTPVLADTEQDLFRASSSGSVGELLAAIEAGADVNATDSQGHSPLIRAVEHRRPIELVETLVEHGADTNARDDYEEKTVLMHAAVRNRPEVLNYLIENGADVHARSGFDTTALMHAAYTNTNEVVELLIEHGADVNAGSSFGTNALLSAATGNNVAVIELLIEHGVDLDCRGFEGATAVIVARKTRNLEAMEMLLQHGANPDLKDDSGLTALIYAARYPDIRFVESLIAHRADVDLSHRGGRTALTSAVLNGNAQAGLLLLEAGANPSAVGIGGDPIILDAVTRVDDPDFLQAFIARGADVNVASTNDGSTMLMRAARAGLMDTVDMLLEAGAATELEDHRGRTAADHLVAADESLQDSELYQRLRVEASIQQ